MKLNPLGITTRPRSLTPHFKRFSAIWAHVGVRVQQAFFLPLGEFHRAGKVLAQDSICKRTRVPTGGLDFAISFENMGEPQRGHCFEPAVPVFSDFTPVCEFNQLAHTSFLLMCHFSLFCHFCLRSFNSCLIIWGIYVQISLIL